MAKKLRILICDDDAQVRRSLAEYVKKLGVQLEVPVQIETFSDGEQLVECCEEAVDFAFLDIEMPMMDGLEAARELRRKDSGVCIVFTTNHEKYAIQGYEVGAWRYMLKPLQEERFFREMTEPFRAAVRSLGKSFCIKGSNGLYCIEPEQLVYVETLPNHQIMVHTRRESFTANSSIRAMEQQADPARFFRCHNSFLINLQYVARIGSDVILKDGSVVPISRYRRTELLKRFTAYLGGKL